MSTPQAFDEYQVVRLLGQGGMGRVYEVTHPGLPGRRLALKLTLIHESGEFLLRFAREAELLARVQHPAVVGVHGTGRSREGPYLVMDLVEGSSLEALCRQGPVEPRRAAELVATLAGAVQALHRAGILHRDLKPENAILRSDGAPVLIDFGLARAQDASRLTRTGEVLGSPAYMPPEQANGGRSDALDARADVYGLGATLFALLCGRPPFRSPSVIGLLHKVLESPPEWPGPQELVLPPGLREIVDRALSKRSEERWPSAEALEQALRAWLRGEAPVLARRGRGPLLAGGLLLAGAAGGLLVLRASPASDPVEAAAPATATPAAAPPVEPPRPAAPAGPWSREHPPGDADDRGGATLVLALGGAPPRFLSCAGVCSWRDHVRRPTSRLVVWVLHPTGPEELERWELPGQVEALCPDGAGGALLVVGGATRQLMALGAGPPVQLPLAMTQTSRLVSALACSGTRLALAWGFPPEPTGVQLHRLDAAGRPEERAELVLDRPEDGVVTGLAFRPDGRLATCGAGENMVARNSVTFWDLSEGAREVQRWSTTNMVTALTVDPRGSVWIGNVNGHIQRVDAAWPLLGDPLQGHQARVQAGAGVGTTCSHGGQVVALRFVGPDRLWSLSSEVSREGNELRAWRREADGTWTNSGGVLAWDKPTPVSLDVTAEGEWLLIGTDRGRVEVWPAALVADGFRARREVETAER